MRDFFDMSTQVARKNYSCDACQALLDSGYRMIDFTFSERKDIVRAQRKSWTIKKGQKYIRQVSVDNGEFSTYKAIPEIDKICFKYKLFSEE